MKDLAVLLPTYNDQDALIFALDAIEEPDNSFTVVVVDGASEKPPVIDFEKYPFSIKLIIQEEHQGLTSGLNEGWDWIHAQGFTYMARLDAGDRQKHGRLQKQYQLLKDSPDLAMVGSNAMYFSEETGEEMFTTNLPLDTKQIRKRCVFSTTFIHPTVMMRLDRIPSDLRYDSKYKHIEDYVLFTKIAEQFPTANIEEALVECAVRESGVSRSNDRTQLMSGIRHHLHHPRPLKPLWYAYILKRLAYLVIPFSLRVKAKKLLGFVKKSEKSESE